MQKESQPIQKTELRRSFLALRNKISQLRQEEASFSIFKQLRNRGRILSFYPIGSEINLLRLNTALVKAAHLIFPRVERGTLVPYHIHCENNLSSSRFGILEPHPEKFRKALLSEIDLILVPGLVFDREGYRLGYGKGYYDRFLAAVEKIPTVGIGLREQLSEHPLPRDPWDIPVKELIFV